MLPINSSVLVGYSGRGPLSVKGTVACCWGGGACVFIAGGRVFASCGVITVGVVAVVLGRTGAAFGIVASGS